MEICVYSKKSGTMPNYPLDDTLSSERTFENNVIGRVLGAYGVVEPPLALEEYGVYGTKGTLINNMPVQERWKDNPEISSSISLLENEADYC